MSRGGDFFASTLKKVLHWAQGQSFWMTTAGSGCCADELFATFGARYDLERFGCLAALDPKQADLLVVSGLVSIKAAPHLRTLYDSMVNPRYVIALGACACSGGAFCGAANYSVVCGVDQIVPVDVYVAGCPPRPEAIMNGLIKLQEKISGIAAQI